MKTIWDANTAVIFTQGQVNEMSSMFEVPHTYTGNDSWEFVQKCETGVQNKYNELRSEIVRLNNLPPKIEIKEVIKEVPVEVIVEKPVIIEKEVQIKPTWSIIWKLILEKLTKE